MKDALQASYQEQKELGLTLNMARGKPCKEQLDLSMDMLNLLNGTSDLVLSTGDDCRNYGILEGIPEMRRSAGFDGRQPCRRDCQRQLQSDVNV